MRRNEGARRGGRPMLRRGAAQRVRVVANPGGSPELKKSPNGEGKKLTPTETLLVKLYFGKKFVEGGKENSTLSLLKY